MMPRISYGSKGGDISDFSHARGFIRALILTMRCQPAGVLFCGVPRGESCEEAPADTKLFAARVCLCMLVGISRSVCWAIESPARGTFLPYYDAIWKRAELGRTLAFWSESEL